MTTDQQIAASTGAEKARERDARNARLLSSADDIAGTGDFFNLLKVLFSVLGMGGGSGFDFGLIKDFTADDIVNSPVYQRDLKSRGFDLPRAGEKYDLDGIFKNETTADAAIRTVVNMGIERHTESCMARGVDYKMGAKGDGSAVDCSGFVEESIKKTVCAAFPDAAKSLCRTFDTNSDGQLYNLAKKTGCLLRGDNVKLENIKAGMIIGMDTGDKEWDRGRNFGIDHVGIVYTDTETGKMMFAQSSSSKGGVNSMPLEDWFKIANKKGYNLYAGDVVKAFSEDYKQEIAARMDAAKAKAATEAKAEEPKVADAAKDAPEKSEPASATPEKNLEVAAVEAAAPQLPQIKI